MSLCIWTSLHLNLPEHKKEHLQKYRKLGWMILGLIAPEMVVWNAWEQRRKMKKVSKAMQEKGFMPLKRTPWTRARKGVTKTWRWTLTCLLLKAGDLPEHAEPTPYRQYNGRIHPWTDVHSWLVVMGGMSFEDSAEEGQQFMQENRQRMNLTVKCFDHMLNLCDHLIPDIPCEYIQDKSKSDRLAKLLTCWQAGYFCIQCVFRLSQRLSVTLLELNVFAHALCSLALFVIWSDKPRDVCEPTLLVDQEAMDFCALQCLEKIHDGEYFHGCLVETSPEKLDNPLVITHPTTFSCSFHMDGTMSYGALGGCRTLKVLETHWALRRPYELNPNYAEFFVNLNARDVRRLQRASSFVQRYPLQQLGRGWRNVYTFSDEVRTLNRYKEFYSVLSFISVDRIGAIQRDHSFWDPWITAVSIFAGTCYGGLHLVAWTTPFASHAEAFLWRAASVSMMVAGPFFALLVAYDQIIRRLYRRYGPVRPARWISDPICQCYVETAIYMLERILIGVDDIPSIARVLGPSITWYTFCRVFIVVESFIMLAHIPDQALQVPTWSAYVPHIV
jgi:hypothetical protein